MLLGGPASFTDIKIKLIHSRLGLTNENFDLVKEHLIETLEDHDLEIEHIDHVSNEFELRRKIVVSA